MLERCAERLLRDPSTSHTWHFLLEVMALRLKKSIAVRLEAIAIRFEAIALRLEAIAIKLEAIAIRLEAITLGLEAIANRLEAIPKAPVKSRQGTNALYSKTHSLPIS